MDNLPSHNDNYPCQPQRTPEELGAISYHIKSLLVNISTILGLARALFEPLFPCNVKDPSVILRANLGAKVPFEPHDIEQVHGVAAG